MPTVPTSQGRSVGLAPIPTPRAPGAVFSGGPPAVDLNSAITVALRIRQEERQRADQIATVDAGSKLASFETDLLHNAETGALTRRGRDAFDQPEEVAASWDQHVSEVMAGLSTDEQRATVKRLADSHWNAINGQVQRHVAGERRQYDQDATGAFLKNEAAAALASFGDPERVQQSIDRQAAALTDFGRRNGAAPEAVQEQIATATSRTRVGVIDRILAQGNDLAAKAYFDAHKAEVVGDDLARIDKALEEGSTRGESQRLADEILTKATTLTEAVKLAREITDPKVRDLAEQRIRADFNERAQARREQGEVDYQRATNIVEQKHDVTKIPPSLWLTFSVSERESLRRYAENLQEGVKPKTDWSRYYQLRTEATVEPTRDAFLQRNLLAERGYLADAQFKELVDLQGSMRKGDSVADDKLEQLRRKDAIVTSTLRGIGLGVSDKAKDRQREASDIDAIRRTVDAQVEAAQERTGKPLPSAEVQQIVDEIVTQHVVARPGRFWGKNTETVRLYDMQPGDELVLTIKDVPAPERNALRSAIQRKGLPATDSAIVAAYRDYLKGLVRRGPK